MAEDGADILDLGAESTRPGAPRVPEEQERERMSAAVAAIRRELPHMPLSIEHDARFGRGGRSRKRRGTSSTT